jgi:endonuclease-3 related protein
MWSSRVTAPRMLPEPPRSKIPLLAQLYRVLLEAFGPQHWWPGETPFEVMVGAVLTQNTNWRNVERAIANLKAAGVLAPGPLSRLSEEELARLVQPSGFFRVKARRLKALMDWLMASTGGDLARLRRRPLARLRGELLAVPGIGPETADSILLYALGKPTFVVDAYTRRALLRHGLIGPRAAYDEVKALLESTVAGRVFARSRTPVLNEYHALFVELGKRFCRPRPRCAECPAARVLGKPRCE